MLITKAEQKDLQEILDLQYLAYQSEARLCGNPRIPPLTQTLEAVMEEFAGGVFLKAVEENGAVVGSVRAFSDGGTLRVGKLMVHPDWQGQGIGTKLLGEIEQVCPHGRYELFTSTKSERNIRLYERAGYVRFREEDAGNGLRFVYLSKISHPAGNEP